MTYSLHVVGNLFVCGFTNGSQGFFTIPGHIVPPAFGHLIQQLALFCILASKLIQNALNP